MLQNPCDKESFSRGALTHTHTHHRGHLDPEQKEGSGSGKSLRGGDSRPQS